MYDLHDSTSECYICVFMGLSSIRLGWLFMGAAALFEVFGERSDRECLRDRKVLNTVAMYVMNRKVANEHKNGRLKLGVGRRGRQDGIKGKKEGHKNKKRGRSRTNGVALASDSGQSCPSCPSLIAATPLRCLLRWGNRSATAWRACAPGPVHAAACPAACASC